MTLHRKSFQVALAALVLAAIALAGCGSTSSSKASARSGGTISVGVLGSFSGPSGSSYLHVLDTLNAWAASVNDTGAMGGKKVQLHVYDDAGDASKALLDVQQMVQKDHVVAIVGDATTTTSWETYIGQQGIPVIGGSPVEAAFMSNPDFYSTGGNIIADYYGTLKIAKESGSKFADLYCAEAPVCQQAVAVMKPIAANLGTNIVLTQTASASAPDYTAPCQSLKSSGADAYALTLALSVEQRVIAACTQQGVKAQPVLTFVVSSQMAGTPSLNGTKVVDSVFPFFDESTPARKAFHDALRKYAPNVGDDLVPEDAAVWSGAKLFEAAVQALGKQPVTANSVTKALDSMSGQTLGGLTPPLTFSAGKPALDNCYFSYQISAGHFTTLNGGQPECAPTAVVSSILSHQ